MSKMISKKYPWKSLSSCAATLGLLLMSQTIHADDDNGKNFFLKDGDNVCFYGDSITEQRFYGVDIETYVRTRFPNLHVKFVNSGVGGDKVNGGWAGRIDLRLERDVFPFKPNVVTIMLGMNDARYAPFNEEYFDAYTNGYEHIIQSLQQHLPGVRIVLIEPSPYDDVTESPNFPGGYDAVLERYSAFVRQLAAEHHLPSIDLNTPLVAVMKKMQAENPSLAHEVIPGRVHPSAAGELVMAQGILQAWNAPSTVAAVEIDASKNAAGHSENTTVSDVKTENGILSWTQKDQSLPFPALALHEDWPQFPPTEGRSRTSFFWAAPEPKWDYTNAATEMIVKDSGLYEALDNEPLKVSGLASGNYQLRINGETVAEFSAQQLADGVNLAEYHTPMLDQSYHVLHLVWKEVEWRYFAWRDIQLRLSADHDPAVQKATEQLVSALTDEEKDIVKEQYAAAQPHPAKYELVPANK